VLRGSISGGLMMAAMPPFALLMEFPRFAEFRPFLTEVAWGVAPFAEGALVVCLLVRPLRMWSLGIPLLAALIAAVFVGERVSKEAMCQAAIKRGFSEFRRNSFRWSLANTPQEFQFDIHASAKVDGQRQGWSYRDMDWYVIPNDAWGAVTAATFSCPN
jgi:hypothetical protein